MPEVVQQTVQFAFEMLQHCDNRSDMYVIALGVMREVITTQIDANLTGEEKETVMQIVKFLQSQFEVTAIPLDQLGKPEGELN